MGAPTRRPRRGGDGRGGYVCEYCGHQGSDPRPVDQVQCPVCGEPVTPTSPR